MKLKLKITLALLICAASVNAQNEKFFEKYDWQKNPALHKPADQDKNHDYYYVSEKHILQYAYDSGNELQIYETWHEVIHINNEKGVEAKNKIYIPTSRVIENIEVKARCINAAGKVINLEKSEIKSVDDLDGKGPYTFFAMKGVEPGCDIEFIYTFKKGIRIYGSYDLELSVPRKQVDMDFISPQNLEFEIKVYNLDKQFTKDTSDKNNNHYKLRLENVRVYKDEKYSADEAKRQRYDYQLRYNTYKSKAKLYTWNLIARDVMDNYFFTEKDDIKAVSKLISKSGAAKESSDEEKIKKFENYFKKNYTLVEINDRSVSMGKLLENKVITEFAMNRIFTEAAAQLNVPYEMVFTSNKYESDFDPEFESVKNLNEFMLYYPSFGKYHTPASLYSRVGFPPYQSTNIKGLFIKITEAGGIKAPIAKCKSIPCSPSVLSSNNINAKVSFNASFVPQLQLENILSGYSAYYSQPIYELLNDEKKTEVAESYLKLSGSTTVVKEKNVLNTGAEDILVKPFIIKGVVEQTHLVEKAGDKVIFKVGMIIGPQEEMYEEKERRNEIEMGYPHALDRTIEITIPQGYKISNLNDINIDAKITGENNEDLALFKSSYKLEGNILTITILEKYHVTTLPKEKINEVRKVINASADFNKVSLVFEKS